MKKFCLETKSNSEDLVMDNTASVEESPEIHFHSKDVPANLTISILKSICIGQLLLNLKNGKLKLEGCLIDPIDCIKVTISEHISQVQQGNTYIFKNIRLKKNSVTNEILCKHG